jgi:hypothetical protein
MVDYGLCTSTYCFLAYLFECSRAISINHDGWQLVAIAGALFGRWRGGEGGGWAEIALSTKCAFLGWLCVHMLLSCPPFQVYLRQQHQSRRLGAHGHCWGFSGVQGKAMGWVNGVI